MKIKSILLYLVQLIPAGILFYTSWAKLSSKPSTIILFSELGMEPTGRYIIGVVEGLAALFLLTTRMAATGGLLAMGTMMGAIIAHVTILGFIVMDDHGRHVMMLALVFTCSVIVTIARRRQLPLIGNTFA